MALNIPEPKAYSARIYGDLKGADFSQDPSLVDLKHSPDLLNLISDDGGIPVKRKGYSMVKDFSSEPVDNLWSFREDGTKYLVATCGMSLYVLENHTTLTSHTLTSTGKKIGFYSQTPLHKGFFVFDGTKYYKIQVDKTPIVEEIEPYIPLIIISRNYNGGGEVYEDINTLTRQRKEQFLNHENKKTFLVTSQVDTSKPFKFEYRDDDGSWKEDTTVTVSGATFTINNVYVPVVVGQDNISITYYATGTGDPDIDKSSMVLGCTEYTHYSKSTVDQIFITGNSKHPQHVFYSALGDPTYFPDLNYLYIGGVSTSVKGFLNLGENLAIVKEQSGNDNTIFFIYQTTISSKSVTIDEKTTKTTKELTFASKPATTGIGAVASSCFGVLNDEPMFLSRQGIYGIVSNVLSSEKIVRNRSYYLDRKLTQEYAMENAIGIVWNNYFLVALNGHVYVLDGRHKAKEYKNNTNYVYEGYYWDNLPISCMTTIDGDLYFGTPTGKLMRFNNSGTLNDYNDNGNPIKARWSTPNDNDGGTRYLKTMEKKGTMVSLLPYTKTSCDVYIEKDGEDRVKVDTLRADSSFGFTNWSFIELRFKPNHTPIRDKVVRRKIKKYKRLKIIIENNELNEPLGIIELVKTYSVNRFVK